MSVDEPAFVGRGWAFPVGASTTGGIAMVTGDTDVRQAIHLILGTTPGERPMRPDFGCNLVDFLFAPMEPNTFGQIAAAVEAAVRRWEPRVELLDVVVGPSPDQDGCLLIQLLYRLRDDYDRRNLVFPFYVIPEHQEV